MVIYFVYVATKNSGRTINEKNFLDKSSFRESPKQFGGIQACLIQLKPVFKIVVGKDEFSSEKSMNSLDLSFQRDRILFL